MDRTLRALNGFGLGARIGERRRMDDPRNWLRAQLQGGPSVLPIPPEATPAAVLEAIRSFRMLAQADPQDRRDARRRLLQVVAAESRAVLTERVKTERPFVERLVAFWSNHLCVSAGAKILVAPLAGSYEREVIRPHVLGRFEDMVLASAKHPAMLAYLDNFQSIGPASPGAALGRGGRGGRRGLNENYARELLELHTLGVDGGYTQQDVQELAKILTGWTVSGLLRGGGMAAQARRGGGAGRGRMAGMGPSVESTSIGFQFVPVLHEPGPKTVLGTRYAGGGVEEGEHAIRALVRHPSTSRFVASKLVRHFVSDEPPPAAVERVARAFRDSDGDLRVVSAALIDLPEAWSDSARKFRTPQEWVVAVLRATGGAEMTDNLLPLLRQLRHPLWSPQAPKGFGDTMQEWADPDALLNRAELARTIARRLRTTPVDPRALLEVIDVPPDDPLRGFLADNTVAADERLALALAGPAFQWR